MAERTINKIHEGNGRHSVLGDKRFTDALRRRKFGTDPIEVGSSLGEEIKPIETASMADLKKLIDGIKYLVRDWIPYGMLSMLMGPPGVGKSAFALGGLVRPLITEGGQWFTGAKAPTEPQEVLWCDTEGGSRITTQRTTDWALPDERIRLLWDDDPFHAVNLNDDDDLERMVEVVTTRKIPLVVIDSLRGAHEGDENNSNISNTLKNLIGVTEQTQAAVLVIHHTKKIAEDGEMNADSSRGSNAIIAMARVQLGIDKPDSKDEWLRLRMLKENLGVRPQPVGFQITNSGIEFGDVPTKPKPQTGKTNAEEWLIEHMEAGKWYLASELKELADADGHSWSGTLQRARKDLGITTAQSNVRKRSSDGKWEWRREVITDEPSK